MSIKRPAASCNLTDIVSNNSDLTPSAFIVILIFARSELSAFMALSTLEIAREASSLDEITAELSGKFDSTRTEPVVPCGLGLAQLTVRTPGSLLSVRIPGAVK